MWGEGKVAFSNGCMNCIPIVLSPVAAGASTSPVHPTVTLNQEDDSVPPAAVHACHWNRLEQHRRRLQDDTQSTMDKQVSSPSARVARVVEFTPETHCDGATNKNNDGKDDDNAGGLQGLLLFDRSHPFQAGVRSLRLPVDPEGSSRHHHCRRKNNQHTDYGNDGLLQRHGGKDGSSEAEHDRTLYKISGRQLDLVDDEQNLSDAGSERLIIFPLECLNCATSECILIDPSIPRVSYCPFCGFPQ